MAKIKMAKIKNKEVETELEETKPKVIKDEAVYLSRGFASKKDAEDYIKSEAFSKLHSADQAELKNWLSSLK